MRVEPAVRTAVRLAAEELAEAILPTVLSRLREQTGRLQDLAGRITRDPDQALVDPSGVESLEADQELGRRIGWCLGVLAAANGTDLLLARRERDGLRDMLALVALARPEHPPEPAFDELPRLATSVGEGWEVPLLVAGLFLHAARTLPAGTPLRWEMERGTNAISFSVAGSPTRLPPELGELVQLVPGAELQLAEHTRLVIPSEWFA